MEERREETACRAVNGLFTVYANANLDMAVFGGVSKALEVETASHCLDEKPHSEHHVASMK